VRVRIPTNDEKQSKSLTVKYETMKLKHLKLIIEINIIPTNQPKPHQNR